MLSVTPPLFSPVTVTITGTATGLSDDENVFAVDVICNDVFCDDVTEDQTAHARVIEQPVINILDGARFVGKFPLLFLGKTSNLRGKRKIVQREKVARDQEKQLSDQKAIIRCYGRIKR